MTDNFGYMKPVNIDKNRRREIMKPMCELCLNTGFYGDSGPGIQGNREYQECECREPNDTAKAMGVTLPSDSYRRPFPNCKFQKELKPW